MSFPHRMNLMFYKTFIDDSGGKEYPKNYPYDYGKVINPPLWSDANTDYWRENYFVLCGIRVKTDDIPAIEQEINKLKQDCFKTTNVEVKSTWLRSPSKRKLKYIDAFGVTEERVRRFGEEFIELIAEHHKKMKIIAVVFDKRLIKRREVFHPLTKATQMILERVHYCGGKNSIIFDEMDPKLMITKGYGSRMIRIFQDNTGVENIFVKDYTNITDCVPRSSAAENFLQVADTCAYAVNKQFMLYGRDWLGTHRNEEGNPILTVDRVFGKFRFNFDTHPRTKAVVGCGISLFPQDTTTRIMWDFAS
jgi:hypothetical protein